MGSLSAQQVGAGPSKGLVQMGPTQVNFLLVLKSFGLHLPGWVALVLPCSPSLDKVPTEVACAGPIPSHPTGRLPPRLGVLCHLGKPGPALQVTRTLGWVMQCHP